MGCRFESCWDRHFIFRSLFVINDLLVREKVDGHRRAEPNH